MAANWPQPPAAKPGTAAELAAGTETQKRAWSPAILAAGIGGGGNPALVDDSMADTLHRHSELSASDGDPNAVVTVDATGNISIDGALVINESGVDKDFRVEAVGQANALFVQGSDGKVGIGTNAPYGKYEINTTDASANHDDSSYIFGDKLTDSDVLNLFNASNTANYSGLVMRTRTAGSSAWGFFNEWSENYKGDLVIRTRNSVNTSAEIMRLTPDGVVINESGADKDFRVEGTGQANALFVDGANGNVGIGTTPSGAQLHIDQATSDAAVPVMKLDQGDADETFIDFIGTSGANANNSISSWTTGASIQGFVRVDINGVQYWMPYYDAPTS